MDIDLAKTFLAIAGSGSFMAAAEQLHLTQTTITARIQNLEKLLSCQLFIRNRNGAQLTDNGRHFMPHAQQLVQVWEASKRDLPLPDSNSDLVSIGCETSLWNPIMSQWLSQIRQSNPAIAIRVEVADHQRLNEKNSLGLLDLVLVHQPKYSQGLHIEHVLDEKLIMVSSSKNTEPYMFIDWGEEFRYQHDAALPHLSKSSFSVNLGPLALQCLLDHGGSGYFRTRVVGKHIESGALYKVPGSPEFSYPVYLVRKSRFAETASSVCIEVLKHTIHKLDDWS